jgi:S1-C subfamily serine protease
VDSLPWLCPSCERRVPHWIPECRCGFKQVDLPPIPVDAPAPAAAGAAGGRSSLLAIAVLVLLAALAAWQMRRQVAHAERSTATVAAAPQRAAVAEQASAAGSPLTTEFARLAPTPVEEPGPATPATVSAPPASLEDVVSQVVPAVAAVTAGRARGTGFFIKPDTVLTNAHVMDGQASAQLTVGAATYTARVVSINTAVDLAVLQVYNADPKQPTLRLGSVTSARVGEEVVAVGSALGVFSNTVTRGIVSAFRKVGNVTLIQTDAAINPGNSGGPLVNRAGQVIGINSLGVSKQTSEGLAFAVAIDHAAALLAGETTVTGQTPLGGLQQQMSGSGSDTEVTRSRGEEQYVQALQAAGRAADAIDDYWNKYAADCVVRAPRGADRPWFGALEPNGVEIGRSVKWDCAEFLDTVRKHATDLRTRMQQASEAARHDGVFPGVVRDTRRRFRLEWNGW